MTFPSASTYPVSPDLARRFNVDRWPTDLLLTSRGEEVHRMISPQDLNDYLRILNQVAWRVNSLPQGTPIQQASQGFHSDRSPTTVNSASPYQFASQAVGNTSANHFNRNEFQASGQPLPQYALNDTPMGISYGPAIMNPVGPNATSSQVTTNPTSFPSSMPQQNGTAYPGYATPGSTFPNTGQPAETRNNPTQQQITLAQQQVAMAQQSAASPQVIENQFTIAPSARPAIHSPPTNNAPPTNHANMIHAPTNNSPAINTPMNHVSMANAPTINAPGPLVQPSLNAPNDVAPQTPPPSGVTSQMASGPALSAPALSSPHGSLGSSPPAAAPRPSPQTAKTETQPGVEIGLEGFLSGHIDRPRPLGSGRQAVGSATPRTSVPVPIGRRPTEIPGRADQYSPALAGFDPWCSPNKGKYAEGLRMHGIRYQDEIYMFVSEESLSRFAESPQRYTDIVRQAIGANRKMR